MGESASNNRGGTVGRRALLAGLGVAVGCRRTASAAEPPAAEPPAGEFTEWLSFRDRFILPNGRVVDTANGGQSHSEGQGWGMLFAARFGDRATFDRISDWRRRVLRRRADLLHAWHCRPGPDDVVDDSNNATDGDILIAWSLLEAAARWRDAALFAEGRALAADILRLLVRASGGRAVLLPGLRGFEHPNYLVLNPSYYVFPAFPALAAAFPDPAWLRIAAQGLALLRVGRFGRWQLPPDWLAIAGRSDPPRPAPGWPSRFAYDAVRVPLYLAWAGLFSEPAVGATARMWARASAATPPAWVDLLSGQSADYPAPTGMRAIARLAIAASRKPLPAGEMPHVGEAADYYSAALTLLARLARQDTGLAA